MPLVDTHCHLHDAAFDEDRAEVLDRALEALEFIVVIGDDLESSGRALDLCGERVHACVGMHPYHAASVNAAALSALKELAQRPGVVALGEIGLDYHYKKAGCLEQQIAFRRQIELAIELDLPIVVHSRDAQDDTAQILQDYAAELPGGIMHCFGGDAPFARKCLDMGFHISFAGNVTFPKANVLRQAAKVVPLDRLLVETDSPYLAPQPVRGRRCEPAYVQHTAEALARLHGVPDDEFADQTTRNARRVFDL